MKGYMKSRGYTLAEILTVVGIIAVLVAIVVPVTLHGTAKARQSRCVSNLRQIGMAVGAYAQDNSGRLPPYANVIPGPEVDESQAYPAPDMLYAALSPYIRNRKTLYCSSDPLAGQKVVRWKVYHLYSSYYFNFRKDSWQLRDDGYWFRSGRRLAPQNFIIARDANCWAAVGQNGLYDPESEWAAPGCQHFDGANYLYLDGHVKWWSKHSPKKQ